MIEDIDPVTVLDFLGVAICTLFRSLVRRANAEDLELGAYQGAVRKSIVRTYRLVFVSGWVLSMLFVSLKGLHA